MADLKLETLLTLKDRASKQLKGFKKNLQSTKSELQSFTGGLAATFGGGVLLKNLFDVNRQFETLRATLNTFTSSEAETDVVFAFIKDIAKDLPESVDDITTSFIRMKALGLSPTREALVSFANTAAASGKGVLQFVEAVADASTGEFERLKEFGIKARKQGDLVAFTFQGQTKTIQNTSSAINEYLEALGNNQFAGAATRQMSTMNGLVANLGDAWDNLLTTFGKQGANDAFKGLIQGGITAIEFLSNGIIELRVDFLNLFGAVELGWEVIKSASEIAATASTVAWQKAILLITELWNDFINLAKTAGNFISKKLGFGELFKEIPTIVKELESYEDIIKRIDAELEKESARIRENVDALVAQARATGQSKEVLTKFNDKLKEEQKDAIAAAESEKELAKARDLARIALENATNAADARASRGESIRSNNRTAQEIFDETKVELDSLKYFGDITSETYKRALASAKESLADFNDVSKQEFGEVTEFAKEAARGIQNSFSTFFFDIMQGNFSDMGDSFKRTIDQMVADFLASQLAGALFGDFGSGNNALGGYVGTAVSAFQGFFADGGNVVANRPAIVGERGPELFTPNVSGTITSNADLKSSSGNSLNITINAFDSKDVLNKLEEIKRPLAEMLNGTNRAYNLTSGVGI